MINISYKIISNKIIMMKIYKILMNKMILFIYNNTLKIYIHRTIFRKLMNKKKSKMNKCQVLNQIIAIFKIKISKNKYKFLENFQMISLLKKVIIFIKIL